MLFLRAIKICIFIGLTARLHIMPVSSFYAPVACIFRYDKDSFGMHLINRIK